MTNLEIFSLNPYAIASYLELGLVFAILALGVFITFRVLDFPDLTVDGSFPLGACVSAAMTVGGYSPFLSVLVAFLAGSCAGVITAWLNLKLKIINLLASIITMTALYSVNLRVMGRPNVSLLGMDTIFTGLEKALEDSSLPFYWINPILFAGILGLVFFLLFEFLNTELGLALRATGSNPRMSRAMGINTARMITLGLALSNGLVALSGSLFAQAQGNADVGMGLGTIIAALVSIIIGETLIAPRNILRQLLSVALGSILYRFAIGLALSVDTGDEWYAFHPSDLNLVTSVLVVICLALPQIKKQSSGAGI